MEDEIDFIIDEMVDIHFSFIEPESIYDEDEYNPGVQKIKKQKKFNGPAQRKERDRERLIREMKKQFPNMKRNEVKQYRYTVKEPVTQCPEGQNPGN
ncbi:MAG: hypothetical protein AABY32_01880 [Nanoarchaeota archaeon]